MGYADHLRALLRPMQLYELNEGAGSAELEALGEQMDAVMASLDECWQEGILSTAEGAGLAAYEALLPFTPASSDTDTRREAVAALLRIDMAGFTPADIARTISGCGIRALVTEESTTGVSVCFPGVRGVPENIDALKARIGEILPCHLTVTYEYDFITWLQAGAWFDSWNAIADAELTWEELSTYLPED